MRGPDPALRNRQVRVVHRPSELGKLRAGEMAGYDGSGLRDRVIVGHDRAWEAVHGHIADSVWAGTGGPRHRLLSGTVPSYRGAGRPRSAGW
jgi:hypothetical protein